MTIIEQIKKDFKSENGVYYLEKPERSFEDIYIKVRNAEGRLYKDSEVKLLLDADKTHRHYKEWQIRKCSLKMLSAYLDIKPKNKTVSELGCGNGWLSNKLAELGFSEVIGLDVNVTELEQAARVFSDRQNLLFVYGKPTLNLSLSQKGTAEAFKFDYIILSSVIAYFKDLPGLIDLLLNMLNDGGEIHITDSPFYTDTNKARERSIKYYNELGFTEMSEHYYHHSLDDLKKFKFSILYNPVSVINKIKRALSSPIPPFHWIRIPSL